MRALSLFAIPAAFIVAAFVFVSYSNELPPSLAGLRIYGPYLVFVLGAVLAASFNRGRALLALVVLCGAYVVQQLWLKQGLDASAARAAYAGLTLFVPLNLALLAVLPERGAFNRHGALRLAVIGVEIVLTIWIAMAGPPGFLESVYRKFLEPAPFSVGLVPQAAIVLGLLALVGAATMALMKRSAVSAAMAGSIIAFAIAAHTPSDSLSFSIFISMAQLMVTVAVLQDTFRMAFHDELTGIPSRRALNERLTSLGRTYTVAMVDVDHFKNFNDIYGHDLGDQVLKMVAAHIADVSGGGKSYRYGGEEFTILFPGKEAAEALPHLEALRREIEAYQLALRGTDRPKKSKGGGKRQRGGWRGKDAVSVTVSIGVAERNDRLTTPQAVIEAADRALYRAKDKGRNRVSR